MTVEEIFAKVASHMLDSIMIHDAMANAYDFLGLHGFSKCHCYHHFAETKDYTWLLHYYSTHYHKLLPIIAPKQSDIIPQTWYKYTTMDVDIGTKRQAIKTMMEKWIQWERDTKKLYQEIYTELCSINEIAAADCLKCLICNVDCELEQAEKKLIKLNTIDYSINTIIGWQESLHKKYKKALRCLFE